MPGRNALSWFRPCSRRIASLITRAAPPICWRELRLRKDEGMKANAEARMTNAEGITNSENARDENSFWDEAEGVVREEPKAKRAYDLEERTAQFGEAVTDFV